jgi:hypothetical protein
MGEMSEPVNKITAKYSLDQRFWIKKTFHGWTTSGVFYDCFFSSSVIQDVLTGKDMGEMSEPLNKITVQSSQDSRLSIKKIYGWTTSGAFYDCFFSSSIKQDNLTRQDMGEMSKPVNKITVQCSLDLILWIKKKSQMDHKWYILWLFHFIKYQMRWSNYARHQRNV